MPYYMDVTYYYTAYYVVPCVCPLPRNLTGTEDVCLHHVVNRYDHLAD